MTQAQIYIPKDDDSLWERFKEACDRERKPHSRVILELIKDWMVTHEPGNPQTALLSFGDKGLDSIARIEGRVRQLCLERSSKFGFINKNYIITELKDAMVPADLRESVTIRIIKWLKEKNIIIYL